MVFKQRRFYGDVPDADRQEAVPASTDAELEQGAAEVLASVADLDATQVSVVFSDGALVLSGFVTTPVESGRAETALKDRFPHIQVENRLRVG